MLTLDAIDHEIRKILPTDAVFRPGSGGMLCYIRENPDQNAAILRKFVQVGVSHPPTHRFVTRVVAPGGSHILFRYSMTYNSETFICTSTPHHLKIVNISDPNNEMDLYIALVKQWLSDWAEDLGGKNA